MSPTPRAAAALALAALSALVVPIELALLLAVALAAGVVVDLRAIAAPPQLERSVPSILSRGVAVPLRIAASRPPGGELTVRQAAAADLAVEPRQGTGALEATVLARRRGRHTLPAVATRSEGPLGLGARYRAGSEGHELLVYPDLPAARRIVAGLRRERARTLGLRASGPIGLGTEFESIRDYLPDDDIRQVNWLATARTGQPMSNQFRVESDRDVICLIDAGRLMGAELGGLDRLDAALDAVVAIAAVADELGDRCGAIAFDRELRRHVRPRRAGARHVVQGLFDLEASVLDSDYELAFRAVEASKRAFVVILCDLIEETAARPLAEAVPVLARRHAVVVASAADPEVEATARTPPDDAAGAYRQLAALDVLAARRRAAATIGAGGADVIDAPAGELAGACVRAYLRAKARGR